MSEKEKKHFMRHPELAEPRNTALLVIDLQEKFVPAIPGFDNIVRNAAALVKAFQLFDLPVLVTEQYPKGLGKTVAEISKCFPILEVCEKITFSCAQSEEFVRKLEAVNINHEIKNIVVCGIETHVCVHQTVLDLLHQEYRVWIVQDAMGSRDSENKKLALTRMTGEGAVQTSTEMLLFEMAFQAGTDKFKQIQSLIK